MKYIINNDKHATIFSEGITFKEEAEDKEVYSAGRCNIQVLKDNTIVVHAEGCKEAVDEIGAYARTEDGEILKQLLLSMTTKVSRFAN